MSDELKTDEDFHHLFKTLRSALPKLDPDFTKRIVNRVEQLEEDQRFAQPRVDIVAGLFFTEIINLCLGLWKPDKNQNKEDTHDEDEPPGG